LRRAGDKPFALPAGKNKLLSPMMADVVDAEARVYRLPLGGEYEKVIYMGRGKWVCVDDDFQWVNAKPLVGYITLAPDDYAYLGPKRIWWVGDESEINPPRTR
jgi:hypothetical protein